jgi:hypothetical protein
VTGIAGWGFRRNFPWISGKISGVAGKTFSGVGGEDDVPDAYDDDARGVYSGPTVVDDGKVAAGLRQLRSLDRPPGPLTGITETVDDIGSGEPTRISALPGSFGARPTAVGRSASTPADAQPVTIAADAARGTMFGRSIHLPDINAPESTLEELSSGSVQLIDGDSGPQAVQPFPLAEPRVRPAPLQRLIAAAPDAAPAAAAVPRAVDVIDMNDDLGGDNVAWDTEPVMAPRRWRWIAAMVAGVGVLGGVAFVLLLGGGSSRLSAAPPRAVAAPAPAPAGDPPPPVRTAEVPAPVAAPQPPAPEAVPAPEPPAPPPVRANAEVADDTATRRRPAAQRSDTKVKASAETPPAPRPNRDRRRRLIREDPDATMAPSLD